jgi:hypothetical protein
VQEIKTVDAQLVEKSLGMQAHHAE